MAAQLGFVDGFVSAKAGRNAMLERLGSELAWERFEQVLSALEGEATGRPPYAPLLMLKCLLVQQWWGLSDAALEEALNDRLSFRRFVGLSLSEAAPDHTTLCRFRQRLSAAGLSQRLFEEFSHQLDGRGLILREGTMVDASLVAAAHRPGSAREGRTARDPDAALSARKGKKGTHYGYKMHAGVDRGSRLIRRILLTPGNVNDTMPADGLVCGDERAVYADKGYAKQARSNWLASLGIKSRIMHKSWGGGPPLRPSQRRHNRLIASRRAEVEGVFATLKRWFGYDKVRYRGLDRNQNHLAILALAYNIKRSLKLA